MLSNIELLNLEKHPLCVISYVLLIEHVYSYNPILIKRIERPAIYSQDKHLTFTANAIEQLDILKVKKISSGKGITCLYDVINNCVTPDGKRLLKERIVLPVSDADEIERRLKMIDVCRDTIGNDPRIEKCLSNIGDLNRLNRRMSMGIMKPNELGKIYDSYKSVLELYSILSPGPNEPLVLGEPKTARQEGNGEASNIDEPISASDSPGPNEPLVLVLGEPKISASETDSLASNKYISKPTQIAGHVIKFCAFACYCVFQLFHHFIYTIVIP
jgi:DNA mismatch repair ATPase MutS